MIEAGKYRWAAGLLDRYNRRLLRGAFASIRVAGLENLRPTGRPRIAAANHSCWWDGCVDLYLTRQVLRVPTFLAMGEQQLTRHRVFSSLGVFSLPEDGAPGALQSMRYATRLLQSRGQEADGRQTPLSVAPATLWIYPQGRMNPSRASVAVKEGVLLLARQSGAAVVPVAQRFEFLTEDHPEVLVRAGAPMEGLRRDARSAAALEREMAHLLEQIDTDITHARLEAYQIVLSGVTSRDRRLDGIRGDVALRRGAL